MNKFRTVVSVIVMVIAAIVGFFIGASLGDALGGAILFALIRLRDLYAGQPGAISQLAQHSVILRMDKIMRRILLLQKHRKKSRIMRSRPSTTECT